MRTRINELLEEKMKREGRTIKPNLLAGEADLALNTVKKWQRGDLRRFDEGSVEKLCAYFKCSVGDLLYIDWEADKELA